MPTIPVPVTPPITIPWPSPRPGVGSPMPSPSPSPSTGNGAIGIPVPSNPGGSLTGPFADMWKFTPDWKFWGALLVVGLSVELVDQQYPEYVWMYVGILLLGFMITATNFTAQLGNLLGR